MSTYSIPYYNQMNGNYNNIPQQAAAGQQLAYPQQSTSQSTQQLAQQQVQQQQPYNYMFYQQQSGGAQQLAQQQQQQPQGAGASGQQVDYSAYNRYSYPGSAQANYYQQSMPSQISQPQPQHYNASNRNYTSAPAAPPIPSNSTASQPQIQHQQPTPVQDTLNPANTSTVGQFQPPGIRPRVTTTMWEDEKTLCYQVDANNVSVVRRADNNMINGTKLLNVAQMTRGRRDGILKSEKVRHVVKIGSMHLKGVWIPFERALAMAQREGIVDLLYPLFVRDIKRVIQTGVTPNAAIATNAAGATGNLTGATTASSTTKSSTNTPATSATSVTSPVNSKATPSQANYYQNYNQQYQYSQYPNQPGATANSATGTASTTAQQPGAGSTSDQYPQQQGQQGQQGQQQMYSYQLSYYPNNSNNNQYYPNYYQQQQQQQQSQQQPSYASYPYQVQQQGQQPGGAAGQQSPVQTQQQGAGSPVAGNGSSVHQSPQVQSVAAPHQQAPQTAPHDAASQASTSQGQPNQQSNHSPVQSNTATGVKEEK
jgi:protein SOK2